MKEYFVKFTSGSTTTIRCNNMVLEHGSRVACFVSKRNIYVSLYNVRYIEEVQ